MKMRLVTRIFFAGLIITWTATAASTIHGQQPDLTLLLKNADTNSDGSIDQSELDSLLNLLQSHPTLNETGRPSLDPANLPDGGIQTPPIQQRQTIPVPQQRIPQQAPAKRDGDRTKFPQQTGRPSIDRLPQPAPREYPDPVSHPREFPQRDDLPDNPEPGAQGRSIASEQHYVNAKRQLEQDYERAKRQLEQDYEIKKRRLEKDYEISKKQDERERDDYPGRGRGNDRDQKRDRKDNGKGKGKNDKKANGKGVGDRILPAQPENGFRPF